MTALVPVISDTGPLSYLHKLGRLDLLRDLFGRILVPPAVVAELAVGHRRGKDLPDVAALAWIELRAPPAGSLAGIDGLGAGETEGIALARALPAAVLVVDDGEARRAALGFGLRVTGTVGVLILAKERHLIELVAPELDRLSTFGFRLAPPIRLAALQRAGESG
jgi:predicted nucleic acid-binding protein